MGSVAAAGNGGRDYNRTQYKAPAFFKGSGPPLHATPAMKFVSASPSALAPRLVLLLAMVLGAGSARADVYTDVSQMVRAGRLAEALARADRHLVTKPRDPQMRYLKGVIQRDSGQLADALVTFTQLTEDYPELPEPYNSVAVLRAAQGEYEQARAALEMAIRTNPSYAIAYENLGDVQARLAGQAYCKALQLDPSNSSLRTKVLTLGITCP